MRFKTGLALVFLLVNMSPFVLGEGGNTSQFSWYNVAADSLYLKLWATRCMSDNNSQDLNVTVYTSPTIGVSTGATVTGTMYKPLGGIDSLTFVSQGDGNYLKNYSFDQDGTYKLVILATQIDYQQGDLNEYIYVADFDFNISFTSNNFSINQGETGTIRNYVKNSDSNAVTGLTGSIDIAYPNSTLFVNDGTISETGNGNYYYNFTAPSTAGNYGVTSSFTCGSNTDSNNQGGFTVNASGGGGSGGGAGGDTRRDFYVTVKDWNFPDGIEIGKSANLQLELLNEGKMGAYVLVKVSISQLGEQEYYTTELTPYITPGKTALFNLDKQVNLETTGSHTLNIQIFKADGTEELSKYVESFDVGGELVYDLAVTCLDTHVLPGKEVSARINIINLGDYFQDIQLTWWVESPIGEKIGQGALPLALYTNEARNLIRGVFIPDDAQKGGYSFKARLIRGELVLNGQCSFQVEGSKEFPQPIEVYQWGGLFWGISLYIVILVSLILLVILIALLIIHEETKKIHRETQEISEKIKKAKTNKIESNDTSEPKKKGKNHPFLDKLIGVIYEGEKQETKTGSDNIVEKK